jgi:hypothetical protein
LGAIPFLAKSYYSKFIKAGLAEAGSAVNPARMGSILTSSYCCSGTSYFS